jgi:DNA-directed RNA polymerase subunit E'/Rpb7
LNDLFVGYVTNISKAGCFVQIGHNCTVRIGLNELSDSTDFDFTSQMPIGRMVAGRITKCIDNGEEMRYNATLRRSLVVYGVGQITKN